MSKKKAGKKTGKKKAASKKKAVSKKTIPTTLAAFGELEAIAAFTTATVDCLDQAVATQVVFACTGVGAVAPSTRLGDLFPSPVQRQGFCGCVFAGARQAGVSNPSIPCQPSTTIGDVIASISC